MLHNSVRKQAESSYHSSYMRQKVHVTNLLEICSHVSKPTMTVREKKHKQGRNYFIRQHLGAWSCLNLRIGPYEDKSMPMKQGLCRCLLAKHDVEPTVENTRPCVTLHPKTVCKLSDINLIQPIYTDTYTPSPSKLLCHIADTILLIKMVKTYDISVLWLLASHDLPSLLCN